MYLISLFVCRRRGQGYGAKVCWCSILFRQFRAQGFVGDLDLIFEVFQNIFNPVLGDGLTVPVVKIFNIFRCRIGGYSAYRGLFFPVSKISKLHTHFWALCPWMSLQQCMWVCPELSGLARKLCTAPPHCGHLRHKCSTFFKNKKNILNKYKPWPSNRLHIKYSKYTGRTEGSKGWDWHLNLTNSQLISDNWHSKLDTGVP